MLRVPAVHYEGIHNISSTQLQLQNIGFSWLKMENCGVTCMLIMLNTYSVKEDSITLHQESETQQFCQHIYNMQSHTMNSTQNYIITTSYPVTVVSVSTVFKAFHTKTTRWVSLAVPGLEIRAQYLNKQWADNQYGMYMLLCHRHHNRNTLNSIIIIMVKQSNPKMPRVAMS